MSVCFGLANEILAKEATRMLAVLYIFLSGLVLLLVLLLSCLFIPLSYKLEIVFEQPVKLSFSLRNCGFGLKADRESQILNWHLLLFKWNLNLKKKSSANQPACQGTLPQSNPTFTGKRLLNLVLDSGWRDLIWHLFEELWRIVQPNQMIIKARIGFDEPHYTGWMMGLAGILQRQNSCYRIDLEGVWDEPCMEGQMVISGKFCLAELFWQLLKFLLQPKVRSSIKKLRRQTKHPYPQTA